MLAKFSPVDLDTLAHAAQLTGRPWPFEPIGAPPVFVKLSAAQATTLRDTLSRATLWTDDPQLTARLCALASQLVEYAATAERLGARVVVAA